MFIFRSIVGKLWMTIIGLVAVVLLTLGLFLFQYIETSFPKTKDQATKLQKLAVKVAADYSQHMDIPAYHQLIHDLLDAQDASLIAVASDYSPIVMPESPAGGAEAEGAEEALYSYSDFFTDKEMARVFAGEVVGNEEREGFNNGSGPNSLYTAVAVPLMNDAQNRIVGALVMYQVTQSLDEMQNYVKNIFVVVCLIGFSMTTFFAFFLSTKITQPILQLKKAADLISKGEYDTKVPTNFPDEIGELGKTFNHMGEELSDTIKALNHEKEHLASVLRSMTDAVITFDAAGNVILANPQGEIIVDEWNRLGWEPEADSQDGTEPGVQAAGRPGASGVKHIPGPMRPLFQMVIDNPGELTHKLHVQSDVWSVVMAPLYSRDAVRGVVAVMRNVTEEFRLDKLRKDFLANVSHELRTPLSMLQGYSEALIDDIAASPEERTELAQVIHDESLRMGRLVRDLLDLAKMESGNLNLDLQPVDIGVLLRRVHRKFAALAKEQDIALVSEFPEDGMGPCQADEDRIEQVLTNLLDNAIRHTPPMHSITIRAEKISWKDTDAVQIEISDQGKGIPAEDLPYIFERFYKADKARTRPVSGGTGLGLSIAKNIVEAHQGSIQVKSQLGQGTTFIIVLPFSSGKTSG